MQEIVAALRNRDKRAVKRLSAKFKRSDPLRYLEVMVQLHHDFGEYKEAESYIKKYGSISDPQNYHFGLAVVFSQVFMNLKKYDKALFFAKIAVDKSPTSFIPVELMFWAFFGSKSDENALTVLDKLLLVFPSSSKYLGWKIILLNRMGHPVEVLAIFEKIKSDFSKESERFGEIAHAVFSSLHVLRPWSDVENFVMEYDLWSSNEINLRTLKAKSYSYAQDPAVIKKGLEEYERLVSDFPSKIHFVWLRGIARLANGLLEEGFSDYEARWKYSGFSSARRIFDVPRWDADDLNGKKILVWGEQGVGDELLFLSVLPEVIDQSEVEVTIEVSRKLVKVVQAWYPNCHVRLDGPTDCRGLRDYDEFDFQIPCGSMVQYCLDSLVGDKCRKRKYIATGPVARSQLLADRAGSIVVGISWRSTNLELARRKQYINHNFAKALANRFPQITFVALQYAMSDEEKSDLRRCGNFLVPDEDFFENIYSQALYVSVCDFHISPHTVHLHLAGVFRKPVISWLPKKAWTRLGQEVWPWWENIAHIYTAGKPDPGSLVNAVESKIRSILVDHI